MGCGSSHPVSGVDADNNNSAAAAANASSSSSSPKKPQQNNSSSSSAGAQPTAFSSTKPTLEQHNTPPNSGGGATTTKKQSRLMISSKPSNNTTNNKGHSKKDKNSSSTTTTPLTRTRADTWETNLLLQATDEDAPPPSHQNSAEGCENPWIGNNNKKTNDPNDTPSALSSALNSSTPPSKQQQRSSSSSGSTSNNTHFTSTTAAAAASPASGLKHRHQEQWQLLWETQSLALVDPVDIPSVWDALVAQCINQGLSAVQMTLLQRKVRAVVRHQLPPSSNNGNINNSNNSANNSSHTNNSTTPSLDAAATTSAASKFAMLLSGGSSSNSHSQHHQLALEARVVLDKHRLLTASLVKRVLPVSPLADAIAVLALSLGNHNNSGVNVLMDRVLTAAVAAAQQTGLEMDVNKQMRKTTTATTGENAVDTAAAALDEIIFSTSSKSRSSTTKQHLQQQYAPKTAPNVLKNGYKMPIPSHVPELDEAVQEWPIGASFSSLAALIAMATTTTAAASSHPISKQNGIQEHANHNSSSSRRAQRLQLLFYCLMDARALKEFLATHPAGGIPVWLFEVGNSTVISLPSLTHYHYFGNAFLPCSTTPKSAYSKLGDAKSSPPAFVASKSRLPVTIDADRAQTCIRDALNRATLAVSRRTSLNGHAVNTNNSSQNGVNYPFDEVQTASPSPSKPIKDAMSMIVPMLPPISAFRKSSSTNDLQHSNAVSPASNNNDSSNHASLEHSMFPFSPLMRKIQQVSEGVKTELYCPVMDELENSIAQFETATASFLEHTDVDEWTLQEFKMWADGALDDIALNAVMHRFFAEGVLPSPALERDLITEKWLEWQKMIQQTKFDHTDSQVGAQPNLPGGQSGTDTLSPSVSSLPLSGSGSNGIEANGGAQGWSKRHTNLGAVWGGIGGIEGLGGTGYGILYCVPTAWWNVWAAYTGWSFMGDSSMPQTQGRLNSPRPDLLQNESLLEKESDLVIRGSLGSYEVMRRGLQRGKDYVLVPPGVWDILFELYSGGPPLPRMVNPLNDVWSSFRDATKFEKPSNVLTNSVADKQSDVRGYLDCNFAGQVLRLPDQVSIETHPLILHVHLCDPLQPYRRGDTGPMSIRVMTMPNQPIWRLYGEIICRFSFHSYKAFDSNGHGMARLWKKMESTGTKDGPDQRYGPWNLVCQSRHAILPLIKNGLELADDYEELLSDWKTYGDYETIESSCIVDNQGLLLEFAVQNKSGDLTWPREAAAKAGKVRRLADEDKKLRQLLQGVGDDGNMLLKPPSIIGLQVDAMDASGRWFTVRIVDSQIVDDDTDEENDDDDDLDIDDHKRMRQLSKKRVKVNFSDHGGHIEWIDVESDRIQTAGRFASEEEQQASLSPTNGNGVTGANGIDAKSKSAASAKRTSSNTDSSVENMKACMVPGFGACGLTNLGNTCYMNSAVQCMAYLPLLRAYLLSTQYKASGDLNKDNPLGTGGKLLEEFANLQRSMWGARLAEHTPNRFRGQLGKTNEQFSGADQQDAQEFLNYMIDVLHEDSNKVRKKPYVESLEDEWVEQTGLPRVGEEAWRRFLRRNKSIMADVAMGQALNTVTCPVCHYSSRNFDPFNLLSIPIPTIADVYFHCTLIRRSTARNCPAILNKPRKSNTLPTRFPIKLSDVAAGPPSENFVAEQYVIALSRLADGGDLRLQIQNLSGIRSNQLRLCRVEEVVNNNTDNVTKKQTKAVLMVDKDGPVSQQAKKHSQSEDGSIVPTQIIAFELSLNPRVLAKSNADHGKSMDEESREGSESYPTISEKAEIELHLAVYGDEKECRVVDTDPLVIAKAVSRSLWPSSDDEFKIGLRVDAKDHRGNWFPGSVIDIIDDTDEGEEDTGLEVAFPNKKVRIHFDSFLSKWDELYDIEHFKKGKVNPLYSHAEPKGKPVEFLVHHRCFEKNSDEGLFFGQSFYIQCHKEWSNARAGAHILAQASRYLRQKSSNADACRLAEKVQSSISELIDLLIDCDREFIRLVLGVSKHNSEGEKARAYRNAKFDTTAFISATNKKVSAMLHRLPFELRVCTSDISHAEKSLSNGDEVTFPFALNITIGNFMNMSNACILHWREPPVDKKSSQTRTTKSSILYTEPQLHLHESSAELLKNASENNMNGKTNRSGSSGIDLGFCLTEFCKVQKLPMSDNWKCPRCKVIREGGQNMNLWRLPDLLTFHIKRFNMSARWHEKISSKVNFPMTGLDMSEWCHKESPVLREESEGSYTYDLIGVMNHYGSMTGGHYVATCKATHCGRDGKEEVAYNFNGVGASFVEISGTDEPSGWGLGRSKPKVNQSRVDAALFAKAVADSAEPMWLQFDDEIVEAISPRHVVSEMAYVLFYRKRRITPSNIAKYCTFE